MSKKSHEPSGTSGSTSRDESTTMKEDPLVVYIVRNLGIWGCAKFGGDTQNYLLSRRKVKRRIAQWKDRRLEQDLDTPYTILKLLLNRMFLAADGSLLISKTWL